MKKYKRNELKQNLITINNQIIGNKLENTKRIKIKIFE